MSLSYIYKLINYLSKNKKTVVAQDKKHLQALIKKEMLFFGSQCNLNHIDVSNITDMSHLFAESSFNGDISGWNTTNVRRVEGMFSNSQFNGDISNWDVSNSIVMESMFEKSQFNGDTSNWKILNAHFINYMFLDCSAPVPYWANINDFQKRCNAIEVYHQKKQLEQILNKRDIHNNQIVTKI